MSNHDIMRQFIFAFVIGFFLAFSTPAISQESPQVKEKKVMIIKKDVDSNDVQNTWISDKAEEIELREDAMFIGDASSEQEKEISVSVSKAIKDGTEVRTIEVTIDTDGEQEVIAWEDNGQVPEEIINQLESHGLDIQLFEADNEMTVTVDAEAGHTTEKMVDVNVNKEMKDGELVRTVEITIEDKGELQKMKWIDNGETPEEVQSQLEALGIDLDILERGESASTQTTEKKVEVNVNKEMDNGELKRTVELTIEDNNGGVQKMKWIDNGETPEEVQSQLEALGIDLQVLEQEDSGSSYNIEIEKEGHASHSKSTDEKKKVYKIALKDGEAISDELRKELEQYGVDIGELIQEAQDQKTGEGPVKIKKRIKIDKKGSSEGSHQEMHVIKLKDGEELPEDVQKLLQEHDIDVNGASGKQMRIMKIKGDDGEVKVIKWDGNGEMPAEMKEQMEQLEKKGMGLHKHIKANSNKAQLGIMLEGEGDEGIVVAGVLDNSAAAQIGLQEGDIITHIDGLQVFDIESLMKSLSTKAPGDEVDIDYLRVNESHAAIATLTAAKASDSAEIRVEVIEKVVECDTQNLTGDETVNMLFKTESGNQNNQQANIIIVKEKESKPTEEKLEQTTDKITPPQLNRSNKLSIDNFKAFPNPTDGVVNIQFDAAEKPTVIQLIDLSGKTVFKETLNQFTGRFNKDIDLSNHQRGQFVLYVIQEGKLFADNIMLQ